jgi:DNA gyrase/topoisomerase IV subunit A
MAAGVRGLRLDDGDDAVVGMITVKYPGIDLSAEAKAQVMQNEYAADDAKKAEASDSLFSDNDFEEDNALEDEAVEDDVLTDAEEDTLSSADEHSILVVSENGFGKRSSIASYRITNRGGKGVKTLQLTDKTGALVAIKSVTDTDDLMIINKSGIVIRLHLAGLRLMGRATQGVKLIDLTKKNDRIASVCKVISEEEENKVAAEAAAAPAPAPAEGEAAEGQNTEE